MSNSISAFNPTNGHFYFLTYPELGTSWSDAQAQAVAARGNLVTINDAAEQSFLNNEFVAQVSYGGRLYQESWWIGYYDPQGDNTFEWVSREDAAYTNWADGEPTNYYGEQYGELNPTFAPGRWNNRINSASEIGGRGIVEVVPNIVGTSSNNMLSGTSRPDIVIGLGGADRIYGNGGGDSLFGGDGNDTIAGSSVKDFISGGNQNDIIYGNGGQDTLIGDSGNDTIYGSDSSEIILGGEGDDTVYGNGGGDLIDSGVGIDTIWLGAGPARLVLSQGNGFDTINNFQLGVTQFKVSSVNQLSFADSFNGAQIFQAGDLLAVVSWQSANTFSENLNQIFIT